MEEIEEEPPPFWLHRTSSAHRRRNIRRVSSLFLNTGVLVAFLFASSLVFLAIVIPSVFSLARQVKSSWSSLNIFLALFAIVCGFLGKRDEDLSPANSPMRREVEDREIEYHSFGSSNGDLRRRTSSLTRNTSSYPDLRQECIRNVRFGTEDHWRFYDDTNLYNRQQFNQRFETQIRHRNISQSLSAVEEYENDAPKTIEVDNCVNLSPAIPTTAVPETVDDMNLYNQQFNQIFKTRIRHRSVSQSVSAADEYENDAPKTIEVDACVTRSPPPHPTAVVPESIDDAFGKVAQEDDPDAQSIENDTPPSSDQPIQAEPLTPPSPPVVILPPPSPTMYLYPPPSPNTFFWPPPSPPPPPPPPPRRRAHSSSMTSKQQIEEIYETIGRPSNLYLHSPPPSPPPPPPPSKKINEKKEKTEKKKGGATKDFLVSFYHQTKRKRKHQKRRSYENLNEFISEPPKASIYRSRSTPEFPPPSPPPPPPPPPPPSVFHNLFSPRKGKKKVHSNSTSAAPSPPPPPPQKSTKDKNKVSKAVSFGSISETSSEGSESPLTSIPPPPPPPYFPKSPWKNVILESYDKSPRSGYSVGDEEAWRRKSKAASSQEFCPSPDVNLKADDFIARFKAKLKMEKMDSFKKRQEVRASPLGPDSILS